MSEKRLEHKEEELNMKARKKRIILPQKASIKEVMDTINQVPLGLVVLTDDDKVLKGVVTDGDIRRGLLDGICLDEPIERVMNTSPVVVRRGYSSNEILRMFSEQIRRIPVVDEENRVVDIVFYEEFRNLHKGEKKVIVRGRAPLRISFAGGGTDVNPYIETRGGVILSTTINKYCFVTLEKRTDKKITIHSSDYNLTVESENLEDLKYDGELDLIKAVIKLMHPSFGMDLCLYCDVPPGSGLGGSAAAASVTAGVLNHLRHNKLDEYQLSELAFQAERVELGVAGGWQDQYAAVFGGFNFMEFKKEDVIVHPLRIKEDILNELESSLLICFTGKTRNSGRIVESQTKSYLSNKMVVVDALLKTSDFAIQMKNTLLKGNLIKFGKLLHQAWLVKKKFDSKVSDPFIDSLYEAGISAGAIGGKILGAGGGGYILFFCPHLKKIAIAKALEEAGGKIMNFNFDFRGLQTWMVQCHDE